jgi:hypothetical protein
MEAIMAIAKHNLYVIEDNAQAIGAIVSFLLELKKKGDDRTRRVNFILPLKKGCYGMEELFTNDDALAHKTVES